MADELKRSIADIMYVSPKHGKQITAQLKYIRPICLIGIVYP